MSTAHPLWPLLSPRSVAIVGASDRPGSNGHAMVTMCAIDGWDGAIYPVNPRLSEVEGLRCYPDLASLPETPDHVLIGVASRMVESVLDQAIALGARAVTILAACHLENDTTPDLAQRIANKAMAAGVAICGANCMGLYAPIEGLRIASVHSDAGIRPGGVAWIAQSGSAFGALAHNDRRLGFSLCVSTGMELVISVADYMDWALEQPQTRVIGLFLESVRNPNRFVDALQKAQEKGIPVVVLKVGRTEKSAQMAVSHTGAIAGNDAAYDAIFRKYGVSRVADMDEMVATLALFESPRRAAPGNLGTVHDSGGERELIVDLAVDLGIEFATLTPGTCNALATNLEPGLVPENPLDAYGTSTDLTQRLTSLIADLANDPNVAMAYYMSDPRDGYGYASAYTDAVIAAAALTDKPLAMVSNYSLTDDRQLAQRLAAVGVPLLRGTRNALLAARHLMRFRDFQARTAPVPGAPAGNTAHWAATLHDKGRLSEQDGLTMLSDFGIATPRMTHVADEDSLTDALELMRFPLVLKTAEDHAHKSDVGGVVLNLSDGDVVRRAYQTMAKNLGPRALLMEMAPKGTELAVGALWDAGFGPIVVLSAGGILIEFLQDSIAAIAPFDAAEARRMISQLRIADLLEGVRGQPGADLDELARQIAAFSQMVAALGDNLTEIDVNPIICAADSVVAVDCLAVGPANQAS
ncbi:acetate--CoA ligase family protein [Roseovarius sp. ZX-A-9]|uniref:acetate--CoA ligase family protein n=1 Tax=Roseovarius sp. ZX-A-9 TaxID=3014783 RepID=UPI002330657E|nr:acetate--CoA ligase family protein [Roseovarius sp. ZX-A-9]